MFLNLITNNFTLLVILISVILSYSCSCSQFYYSFSWPIAVRAREGRHLLAYPQLPGRQGVPAPGARRTSLDRRYAPRPSMPHCLQPSANSAGMLAPAAGGDEDAPRFAHPPITVHFEIPGLPVSGLQVRYLKVFERSGYVACLLQRPQFDQNAQCHEARISAHKLT